MTEQRDGGEQQHEEGTDPRRPRRRLRAVALGAAALLLVALVAYGEVSRHAAPPTPSSSSFYVRSNAGRGGGTTTSTVRSDPSASASANTSASRGAGPSPPGLLEGARDDLLREEEVRDEHAACSCYHRSANATCCRRAVLTNHKFGWVLTGRLFQPLAGEGIQRLPIHPHSLPHDVRQDYRHVAVARNYPEAFVSGYLYHQSGRECWRFYTGARLMHEKFLDWGRYVNQSAFAIGPSPPGNNRSLCRYLADEAEEDGMKVYMAVALQKWYLGVDDYYRRVKERRRQQQQPQQQQEDRTLFLCLGDFPDPPRQERMFDVVADWLYPGGHNLTLPPGAITNSTDRNGHASPGNATHRRRLLELVERLDRDVFNGTVAATNALLGCPGTIHRGRR